MIKKVKTQVEYETYPVNGTEVYMFLSSSAPYGSVKKGIIRVSGVINDNKLLRTAYDCPEAPNGYFKEEEVLELLKGNSVPYRFKGSYDSYSYTLDKEYAVTTHDANLKSHKDYMDSMERIEYEEFKENYPKFKKRYDEEMSIKDE